METPQTPAVHPTPTPAAHAGHHPPPSPMDLARIAQDFQIRKVQVEALVQLFDEGNTVPFITRYRKERTGGLNEDIIRRVQHRLVNLKQLNERKQTILKSIDNQGKLTEELRTAILGADSSKRLEDLYLPYKPRKRTLASDARDKGLGELAQAIWTRDPVALNLGEILPGMVNPEKGLNTPEEIVQGVGHILAEEFSETVDVRAITRIVLWESGRLTVSRNETLPDGKGLEYKDYFQFTEPVKHIPPHRILAINRGEKENVLKVKLEFDEPGVRRCAQEKLGLEDHPHRELLLSVLEDAIVRLLLPSLERELRRELTERAQDNAIVVFARNLRSLLLQPPLRSKRVLAIDPGFRTGCKLAALDETGNLLEAAVIHPHAPQKRMAEARNKLEAMIRQYQIAVIAIGNGTACRDTEELVAGLIAEFEARRRGELPPPSSEPTPLPAAEPVAETPEPSPQEPAPQVEAVVQEPVASAEPLSANAPEPIAPVEEPKPKEPWAVTAAVPEATSDVGESAATPPEVPASSAEPQTMALALPDPALTPAEPPAEMGASSSPPAPAAVAKPAPPAPPPLIVLADLPEPLPDLAYVVVNEAGASDYSTSPQAREEFPEFDATLRGTISIGRRLQDPLSELVKIDPQHVGVGLYQHDVHARHLKETLEEVIESCVNHVGVDLNTASVPLLRHVAGLNQHVARELLEYRQKHGPFTSREQLKQVPGIGDIRWIQAAGFLKILGGDEPLDGTWIHPESYAVARQLLVEMGFDSEVLRRAGDPVVQEKIRELDPAQVASRLHVGEPTVKDILEALARPGRDPREDLPAPVFKKGVLKLEDLHVGMELRGTVLNVVPFGAFIDIGLKDSGLVHISQMANRFIKSPHEVVSVGDVVTVWVLNVDAERKRASLTMIPPGTERKPPERRPQRGERRPPQEGRPPRLPQPAGTPGEGAPREQTGERPPRGPALGRGPGSGPGRGQPRGRRPMPQRGPHPAHGGGESSSHTGEGPGSQPAPRRLPERKPPKPRPLPNLSQAKKDGKEYLTTLGELEAFFKMREEPGPETGVQPPSQTPPAQPTPPPADPPVEPGS